MLVYRCYFVCILNSVIFADLTCKKIADSNPTPKKTGPNIDKFEEKNTDPGPLIIVQTWTDSDPQNLF